VANLVKLVWDEFYLCDPKGAKLGDKKCACGNCHVDDLMDLLIEKPDQK